MIEICRNIEMIRGVEGGERERERVRERSIKNGDIPFVSRGVGRNEILSEIRGFDFTASKVIIETVISVLVARNRFGIDKTLARTRASFLLARLLCRKFQRANCPAFISRTDAILTDLTRAT